MKIEVTNNSPATQGVHTRDGRLIWIKAGATRIYEAGDLTEVESKPCLSCTVIDGVQAPPEPLARKIVETQQGRPDVDMSLLKRELQSIARAENVVFESDDNKADLIRKIEEKRAAQAPE